MEGNGPVALPIASLPPHPRRCGGTHLDVSPRMAAEGLGFGRWGVGMSTLLLETCFFQSISSPLTPEPSVGKKIISDGFFCLIFGSTMDEIALSGNCACI